MAGQRTDSSNHAVTSAPGKHAPQPGGARREQRDERLVVATPDAHAQDVTVVVEAGDARVARPAVVRAERRSTPQPGTRHGERPSAGATSPRRRMSAKRSQPRLQTAPAAPACPISHTTVANVRHGHRGTRTTFAYHAGSTVNARMKGTPTARSTYRRRVRTPQKVTSVPPGGVATRIFFLVGVRVARSARGLAMRTPTSSFAM